MAYAPFGEGYAGGQQYVQFTGAGNAWTVYDNENQTGSLEDFMFRRYNPVQGRWISPDPAGLGAVDPSNPQTWNRYAYVMNNPLNYIDPLGLGPCGGRPCVYMPPNNPGDEFDWLELSFWSDISGEDAFYVLAFPGAGGPCAFGLCGDLNATTNNCSVAVSCDTSLTPHCGITVKQSNGSYTQYNGEPSTGNLAQIINPFSNQPKLVVDTVTTSIPIAPLPGSNVVFNAPVSCSTADCIQTVTSYFNVAQWTYSAPFLNSNTYASNTTKACGLSVNYPWNAVGAH